MSIIYDDEINILLNVHVLLVSVHNLVMGWVVRNIYIHLQIFLVFTVDVLRLRPVQLGVVVPQQLGQGLEVKLFPELSEGLEQRGVEAVQLGMVHGGEEVVQEVVTEGGVHQRPRQPFGWNVNRYLLGVLAFFTQNLLRSPSDTPNTWKVSKASVQSVPRVRSSQFRPPG